MKHLDFWIKIILLEFIMIAVQLFIVNRLQKIVFIFILLLITTGLYRKRWMPQNLRTILITTKSRHCSIIKKLRWIRRTRKNLPIRYIRLVFKFWDCIVIFRGLWICLAIYIGIILIVEINWAIFFNFESELVPSGLRWKLLFIHVALANKFLFWNELILHLWFFMFE